MKVNRQQFAAHHTRILDAAIRQAPQARAAMTAGLRKKIECLSRNVTGADAAEARRAAIGNFATMIGAVVLARLADDPQFSDELLEQARVWLGANQANAGKPDATALPLALALGG